ncbi:hypothetical protein CB1_001115001, partial [Camelus ferus]
AESCIDRNPEVLKRELVLTERNIISILQLFTFVGASDGPSKPKPFSQTWQTAGAGEALRPARALRPIIKRHCCLEKVWPLPELLEPLGSPCAFADNFYLRLPGLAWGGALRTGDIRLGVGRCTAHQRVRRAHHLQVVEAGTSWPETLVPCSVAQENL